MAEQMKRIVSIRSEVEREFAPDLACLRITLQGEAAERDACIRDYNERLGRLKAAVVSAGFSEDELKSEHFRVSAKREDLYEKSGRSYYRATWRLVGYEYSSTLSLTMPAPFDKLSTAWSSVVAIDSDASIEVIYEIADKERARESLMADAVERGREKAEVLATAAGMRLGEPVVIAYGTEVGGIARRMELSDWTCPSDAAGRFGQDFPDFNPAAIDIECSVDIDWEMTAKE